jgi:hypothetical protein
LIPISDRLCCTVTKLPNETSRIFIDGIREPKIYDRNQVTTATVGHFEPTPTNAQLITAAGSRRNTK